MPSAAPIDALLAAALSYAARGWPVFPVHTPTRHVDSLPARCSCRKRSCDRVGKHPRTKNGLTDATTDESAIRAWWSATPDANIGIATGRGLVVIDIDPARADEGLSQFESALPTTPLVHTGSNGRHHYLRGPDGVELKNSVSMLAPGVDVRGDGGYVVAPPSLHASGRRYSWDAGADIDDIAIAELPDDVFRRIVRPARARSGSSGDVASFVLGGRNNMLTSIAGTLRRRGLGEAAIEAALLAANDEQCEPPLDAKEVQTIARSIARYPSDPSSSVASTVGANDSAEAWTTTLARGKDDAVKSTFGNLCKILRHSSQYGPAIALNSMALTIVFRGRPISDGDIARIREEIERDWRLSPAQENVIAALRLVAEENAFHPVRRYLDSLQWDGVKRIDGVAASVLGVDSDMARRMIRAWFVSAVARVMRPGCKVDTALVLVGPQGALKSTFFKTLGGEWFSDTQMDITDKDGLLQLASAWIYEWAEIENVTSRKHSSEVKAFVTSATDTFRPPFGRAVVRHLRSSVIVGSTNQEQFLVDDTGSRRFWIVNIPVGWKIDTAFLASIRDQLWAESAEAFNAGEQWWLSDKDDRQRELEAADHAVADPWTDVVSTWVAARPLVKMVDVLTHALGIRVDQQTRAIEMRVGGILRSLGWIRRRERLGEERAYVYRLVTS